MSRNLCDPTEDILRAVCEAHWDGKRISADLFEGRNISVSRLALKDFQSTCDIFKDTIKSPVVLTAEIKIEELQEIGRSNATPKELTVEEAPSRNNPAHAEIPQQISIGLSRRIVNAVKQRDIEP